MRSQKEKFAIAYGRPAAHATVHENIGSSHTLGVAVSIDGGAYSANGSYSVETHSSAGGSQSFKYGKELFNRVRYRHYYQRCYDEITVPETIYEHCVTKPGGSGPWYKTQGGNVEFDAGVSLSGFGVSISLYSNAAYSNDTEMSWSPTANVWLCGSDNDWTKARNAGAHHIDHYNCPPPGPCDLRPRRAGDDR